MAEYLNFDSLQSDVRKYLERGASPITDPDVYAQIPRLINATERKIIQTLKLQGQVEVLRDAGGLASGVSIITKPDRWRETKTLFYGAGTNKNRLTPLFPRSYDHCRSYWPDDTETGVPQFYAEYDYDHYLIAPTPDQTYPLELTAYMQPILLDADNQTNFFTDYAPNMLLYGTLLEATPFLKNDERIPTWQGFWSTEIITLGGQDLQKILDQAVERTRP